MSFIMNDGYGTADGIVAVRASKSGEYPSDHPYFDFTRYLNLNTTSVASPPFVIVVYILSGASPTIEM